MTVADDRIALPFGLVALVVTSTDDRPAPAIDHRARARRDPTTGHRWEYCGCGACRERRRSCSSSSRSSSGS